MSKQNVEIVRDTLAAVNSGDLDLALSFMSEKLELDFTRAMGPYRGSYGFDQVRQFIEEFMGTFESAQIVPTEFIDFGDHVVVPLTFQIDGRDGIEAVARSVQLWTLADGAVTRVTLYHEREQALEAAGTT